jgi:flagellar protein FlbT
MALVIHLKAGAQVIVNGAVLENVSGRTVSLAVQNDAAILRGNDILPPDAARTPASRIYYALQCAYLFPERRHEHMAACSDLLCSYLDAAPSAGPIGAEVLDAIKAGDLYDALKRASALIVHEGKVLSHAQERLVEELQYTAPAGQPAGDGGVGADAGSPAHEGGPDLR